MGDEAEERFRKHHLRIDSESKPECGRKSRFGGFIRSRRVEEKVGSKKKMDEEGIWNGSLGFSAVGVAATLIIVILCYLLTK
ncbi:BnaCnng40670D [Brassica napus]|uniref:BnaCnng40670D protein n=1 Tax=Brassica napus TaxID=3708 RepID=A0A078JDL5_BRANA|nr:BnaCnng40670D [Brassica napus]